MFLFLFIMNDFECKAKTVETYCSNGLIGRGGLFKPYRNTDITGVENCEL